MKPLARGRGELCWGDGMRLTMDFRRGARGCNKLWISGIRCKSDMAF